MSISVKLLLFADKFINLVEFTRSSEVKLFEPQLRASRFTQLDTSIVPRTGLATSWARIIV